MKNIFVIILLLSGLILAVYGINTIQSATADVSLLGLEINASDESSRNAGIMYLLLGASALVSSFFFWKKS